MEKPTGKQVAVGGVVGAIAAVALGWQQIGAVFVLQVPYRSDQVLVQLQIIDVQIIQANAELNAILQRENLGKATASDLAQKQILIQRIANLQEARARSLRK